MSYRAETGHDPLMSYEPTNDYPHVGGDRPADHETGTPHPPLPAATGTLPNQPGPAPARPTASGGGPNTARRAAAVVAITGFAFVGAALFAVALIAAVIVGAVIGIGFETDAAEITHAPTAIDEVPTSIVADKAHVVIDLTSLSVDDFDPTEPLAIDVDVEYGSVEVVVPDGVTTAVDAETDVGATSVFGRSEDGFDNRVVVDDVAQPDLDLTIDLDVGDIDVDRG